MQAQHRVSSRVQESSMLNRCLQTLMITSVLLSLVDPSDAVTVKVHCSPNAGRGETINAALHHLDPSGPNTIRVSGLCKENVVVEGFDRLTMIAEQGAAIADPSGGNNPTIIILDSRRVVVRGFAISGGSPAVICGDFSLCRFKGNTIQNAADDGVVVSRSEATFEGDLVQDNPFRGIVLREHSTAVIAGVSLQGNGGAGSDAHDGSFLYSFQSTIQNNGFGLRAEQSRLRIELTTITNNSLDGVQLQGQSSAWFAVLQGPNTIAGSGFQDVSVNDLSFA